MRNMCACRSVRAIAQTLVRWMAREPAGFCLAFGGETGRKGWSPLALTEYQ